MYITKLKLKNWKNFQEAEINLRECTYLLGANALGKSNLLDVFRFLRDISKPQGGGLQKAVSDRDGIKKLRCLHAKRDTEVRIEVHFAADFDAEIAEWEYCVGFKAEGTGLQRIVITEETVKQKGNYLLIRPDKEDTKDKERLTQTHLEQIQTNQKFRDIAKFFSEVDYLHLVPQLLKYSDKIGGNYLEDDPFGQGFLKSLATTPKKTRASRLQRIQSALEKAIPQFEALQFESDEMGHPHLKARYKHYRPNAGWQKEKQFSDGTLRLIGILWSLLGSSSLLLLEEPELSLNDGIVEQIPVMMWRLQKERKKRRQTIITTHSESLLSNQGIDGRGIIILEPGQNGTKVRHINQEEEIKINAGFSIAQVVLPKARPALSEQLSLF